MSDTAPGPTPETSEGTVLTPESSVVASVVASLDQLETLDVCEHPALFESIHADLRALLNASAHR